MYCFLIILAFVVSAIDSQYLTEDIKEYFKSDAVFALKREWKPHRQAVEHAIASALQEVIGRNGMNVFIVEPKKSDLELSKGYSHQHGRVHIVFIDLKLAELPQCWLPDVSFPLASNLIKIESKLSKIIVTADYYIMRNKSDLVNSYNPYKHSPFLFDTVPSMGKIALTLDGCVLSGYVITRLNDELIDLGHHKFTLTRCDYGMEIYGTGHGGPPPVITRYSAKTPGNGFGITQLVLQLLRGEIISKIQGALFSYVNITAIYEKILHVVEEEQSLIFLKTAGNLSSIVRDVNENIARSNFGSSTLEDFFVSWDDITPYNINDFTFGAEGYAAIKLTNMVLTGLDTLYLSNSGGPYKLDSAMIGEQIRFSTLQVRGKVSYTRKDKDQFRFAVEIRDLAANVDIDVEKKEKAKIEMAGYREVEFSEPRVIFKPSQAIITSHVLSEISMAISRLIKINISKPSGGNFPSSSSEEGSDQSKDILIKNKHSKHAVRGRAEKGKAGIRRSRAKG